MKTQIKYKTIMIDDYEYYIFYLPEHKPCGSICWVGDELERLTFDEALATYPIDSFRWVMVEN